MSALCNQSEDVISPNQINMKLMQLKWLVFGMLTVAGLFTISAFNNNYPNEYEPILMSRQDMEAAVRIRDAREIEKPGKIWVYNNFIFVIEKYKGIHVLDNTDSENPKNISFIQIDGCTDVAVKNGVIYANNAIDLIGVKPSTDYQSIDVVSRNRNILPQLESPNGWNTFDYEKFRPENTIIVRWEAYKSE